MSNVCSGEYSSVLTKQSNNHVLLYKRLLFLFVYITIYYRAVIYYRCIIILFLFLFALIISKI